MKLLKLGLAIGLATAFASAMAEDAKALMQKHCADFDRAMLTKNMTWFEGIAAKDYHEIDEHGKRIDRATSIAMMKGMFQAGNIYKISTKVISAKQSGSQIVAICVSTMAGTMKMSPQAKVPSKIKSTMRFQETWKKEGKGWKISELKTLTNKTTVDGKPMKSGM